MLGCAPEPAGDTSPAIADETTDSGQFCSQEEADRLAALYAPPPATLSRSNTPFRCLRLIGAERLDAADRSLTLIDIRGSSGADVPGGRHLRVPLYEIKSKSFLRDKDIAIVSDGKRYAAIERECSDMRAAGIRSVLAVLPAAGGPGPDTATGHLSISPREFIAERGAGVWHIVDASSGETLDDPVFRSTSSAATPAGAAGDPGSRGLQRTLLVFDDAGAAALDQHDIRPGARGATFVLEGGLAAYRRFEAEVAAMALARARPRISERGCRG